MIKLTQEIWNKMVQINNHWNNKIFYKKDIQKHNKSDYWDSIEDIKKDCTGDCEEFAMIKQHALKKEGIESDIALCWVDPHHRKYHAVCVVDTDKGTFILDNRYHDVYSYEESIKRGYTWHKRQKNKFWYVVLSFFSLFLLYSDAIKNSLENKHD